MSVLIKNMKLPKCCSECPLEYDQFRCSLVGYSWYEQDYLDIGFDPNISRLPECPLVDVPMPHERLIDWDWFMTRFASIEAEENNQQEPK